MQGRTGRIVIVAAIAVLFLLAPLRAGAAALLVADKQAFSGGSGGVIRVDLTTGERSTVSANATQAGPDFVEPVGIALEASGKILVADSAAFGGTGAIIRVDPVSGVRTALSENSSPAGGPSFSNPRGITVTASGTILVADPDAFGGDGGIIGLDPVTGKRTTVSEPFQSGLGDNFADPTGLALPASGEILAADRGAFAGKGAVFRVNPANGQRTVLSNNTAPAGAPSFEDPFGIALDSAGSILIADTDAFGNTGGIIRVDPASGQRTTVSSNSNPAGEPGFSDPFGVAVLSGGEVLVADADAFGGTGGIIRVDPASGARTTVSANSAQTGGPNFKNPIALAFEPNPPSTSGGASCHSMRATLVGTSGPDTLKGTSEVDVIASLGGKDSVRAVGGNDLVCAGGGNDNVSGGSGRDSLDGGGGNDDLIGGSGKGDVCKGGQGKRDKASNSCERTPAVP